jgi:Amino acid permease
MFFTIGLLIVIIFLAWRAAPREREEDAHIHGAGQVGLLGALALFGVDYFTSYYYATGELMHSLHPYGLEHYGYIAVVVIAIANIVFGALYMYSLGVFHDGGGSFTAALRYLGPFLSIIVAVVLLQDYIFTIVVSTLSGVEQLLSLWNAGGIQWVWRFLIGASMVVVTWFITIRGRGESAQVVFTMLGIFVLLTILMVSGLIVAKSTSIPPLPSEQIGEPSSIWHAMYLLLAASMKGLVALSGLEAMSNGIQFVKDEDAGITKWGKKYLPKLRKLWAYYSGKSGIGRYVQTAFLFYGGLTTLILSYFSIQFNAFDGVDGRSLVGNLAFIGFTTLLPSGGQILFWAYQILAVGLLTSASMTAFQDLQAITWRNVAVGEIPEIVVFRNKKGTFTRPVTAAAIVAILVQLAVKGDTSAAVPYYGVGVFLPIAAMGLAMRQHVKKNLTGRKRAWGLFGTTFGAALAGFIFIGQIVGKWTEGGWVVLIVFAALIISANLILVSPAGYREPKDIHRIVREKSRVHGTMGNMAEWQSLRIQEYRYHALLAISRFFAQLGIIKPVRFEKPMPAGKFEDALNHEGPDTFLEQFMKTRPKRKPRAGGAPRETAPEDEQADD